MIAGLIDETVKRYVPPESVEEQWDIAGLDDALAAEFQMQAPVDEWLKSDPELTDDTLRERLAAAALAQYAQKEEQVGPELMRQFERSLMLQTLDSQWRDHLAALDHLRQGIHLRGYAQKNPKQEYKRESFELFSDMLDRIKHDVVKIVLTVQVRTQEDVQAVEEAPAVTNVRYQHADYEEALAANAADEAAREARAGAVRPRRREGRPQRPLPVRLGQEVQAVPRPDLTVERLPVGAATSLIAHRPATADHARPLRPANPGGAAAGPGRRCSAPPRPRIKNWQRDDVLLVALRPGHRRPPASSRRTASARRR